MDRLLYVSMTGAQHALYKQASTTNNLANVNTQGYKAETNSFRALWVYGDGMPTRTFAVDATTGSDMSPGTLMQTGRDLDMAIQGKGWFAVQAADGSEAYTRNGGFQMDSEGTLMTGAGQPVIGDGGPIQIPANVQITIGRDGTISTVPNGNGVTQVAVLGRVKLVNPDEKTMVRGEDGLFRTEGGQPAEADNTVVLAGNALESSNVNAAKCMVDLITQSRQFDMQVKMMQTADQNAQKASQILSLSS
ncbi:flagellar basal-body rod protein FlgF [Leeia sp. TBRC 13508]|uniref:Flagellar basal-body rod protein FlgF n=1 Tax=Leeia speluncae TaxID=2884804 RepID=A0ABS8D983_9NEIS|nr:flagellar basal-body rod protein FlgF [Leeia speluncae]MCB6184778.1 flagellar basal-body rod protein FlgF [Leeia speluncae]